MIARSYDEAQHVYRLNHRVIPGVTSILKGALKFAGVRDDVIAMACARGTAVHKATEIIDRGGRLDPASVDPRIAPYIRGYEQFIADTGYRPLYTEHKVWHDALGFAGTLDKFGELPKLRHRRKLHLIELKATAQVPCSVGMQTAGYDEALRAQENIEEPFARWCLHLKPGDYKLVPLESVNDWAVFSSALTLWRFARDNGLI